MRTTFQQELLAIERLMREMGAFVEQRMAHAMNALRARDTILALRLADDTSARDLRQQTRSRLIAIMACHAPVARDLRFLLAVQVVVMELDQISEQVVGILHQILQLKLGGADFSARRGAPDLISPLCEQAQGLGRRLPISIQALITMDGRQARTAALEALGLVQRLQAFSAQIEAFVPHDRQPDDSDGLDGATALHLLLIAHHLETIGGYLSAMCDDIVFMVAGDAA